MKLLKDYLALEKAIHDHFGYTEDWVTIPLDDRTDAYWFLDQKENGTGKVVFGEDGEPLTPETIEEGARIYSNVIYTQRFLPKWVYRTKDYTMICVDTRTDGNKYLAVFDNSREQDDESLKWAHSSRWGHLVD